MKAFLAGFGATLGLALVAWALIDWLVGPYCGECDACLADRARSRSSNRT